MADQTAKTQRLDSATPRESSEAPTSRLASGQADSGDPGTGGGKTDPILRVGQFGKYRIVGKIGAGGFGQVYLGHDPLLGRDVAVKTCTSDDERLRRRFLHEAKIAAGLQHPNIVTVYDFGYEGEVPFMVQEYLSGEDLTHKIEQQDLSWELRLEYLVSIASGMAHAHDHGVLHRDIKPANIRVLDDGQVRILDFGIARLLNQTTAFTTDGVAMGTVGYLAPELLGSDEVDERSDIFSFGVLAYELLCYQRPFLGETFVRISYQLLNEDPAPLAELAPECPPALVEIVEKCLCKSPGDRIASFQEILAGLARLIEDSQGALTALPPASSSQSVASVRPMSVTTPTVLVEDLRAERRPSRRWVYMTAIALALVLLGVFAWTLSRSGVASEALSRQEDRLSVQDVSADSVLAPSPVVVSELSPESSEVTEPPSTTHSSPVSPPSSASPPPATEEPELPAGPAASSAADSRRQQVDLPATVSQTQEVASQELEAPGGASLSTANLEAATKESEVDVSSTAVEASSGTSENLSLAASSLEQGSTILEKPETSDFADPGSPDEDTQPMVEKEPARVASQPSTAAPRGVSQTSPELSEPAESLQKPNPPGVKVLPTLIDKVQPTYPPRARRRRQEATVNVGVRIGANGKVVRTLLRSTTVRGLGFEEAALEAARQSTYKPGTEGGTPVAMWTQIEFRFKHSN